MADAYLYVMLISSLPQPVSLFGAKQTPISRIKLERRLRMLTPEDAATLAIIVDAVAWYRLPMSLSEEETLERGRHAMAEVEHETLRNIIRDRLELRTCVAALRRRHKGEPAPAPNPPWGYGRWTRRIAANWGEPGFRVEGAFPWIREADQLLKHGDSLGLERLLMRQVWTKLNRYRALHLFDFEAVVIYALRWHIIDRWTHYDGAVAGERFDRHVDAALGAQAVLPWDRTV